MIPDFRAVLLDGLPPRWHGASRSLRAQRDRLSMRASSRLLSEPRGETRECGARRGHVHGFARAAAPVPYAVGDCNRNPGIGSVRCRTDARPPPSDRLHEPCASRPMKASLALLTALAIGAILVIGALTSRDRPETRSGAAARPSAASLPSSMPQPPGGVSASSVGDEGTDSPSFQLWSKGIHARAGVSCAHCHVAGFAPDSGAAGVDPSAAMAVGPTGPLELAERACTPCHGASVNIAVAEARATQERTRALMARARTAVAAFLAAAREAQARGAGATRLGEAHELGALAQASLELVRRDGSLGVHAPQEAARLLAEAIDDARLGQAKAVAVRGVRRSAASDSAPGP